MRHLILFAILASCDKQVDLDVEVRSDPSYDLLAQADQLRISLTQPPTTTLIDKTAGGFEVALDVAAEDVGGFIVVEALAQGSVIAAGRTPTIPSGGLAGQIVVFVAPPYASSATTVSATADQAAGAAPVRVGAALVGGQSEGSDIDSVLIYNTYTHALQTGVPLDTPLANPGLASSGDYLLIAGGTSAGTATSHYGWYEVNVAPAGRFTEIEANDRPRAGPGVVRTSDTDFVASATPSVTTTFPELTSTDLSLALTLSGDAAFSSDDDRYTALFVGDATGAPQFFDGQSWVALSRPPEVPTEGSCIAGVSADRYWVLGGMQADPQLLWEVEPSTDTWLAHPSPLASGSCRAVVQGDEVFVLDASGAAVHVFQTTTPGQSELIDLPTARANASLVALPNGQLLLASGGSTELWLLSGANDVSEL